jgi:hypothetical protein
VPNALAYFGTALVTKKPRGKYFKPILIYTSKTKLLGLKNFPSAKRLAYFSAVQR